jgi:hypothetical protein
VRTMMRPVAVARGLDGLNGLNDAVNIANTRMSVELEPRAAAGLATAVGLDLADLWAVDATAGLHYGQTVRGVQYVQTARTLPDACPCSVRPGHSLLTVCSQCTGTISPRPPPAHGVHGYTMTNQSSRATTRTSVEALVVGRARADTVRGAVPGQRGARLGGRGLHSPTSQLNLSALYGIGGARRGFVARVKGVFRVCRVFFCSDTA